MFLLFTKYETNNILLTKTTAAQNEIALSYHRVRGLYFLAVFFVATIVITRIVFMAFLLLRILAVFISRYDLFLIFLCASLRCTFSEDNLYTICLPLCIVYTPISFSRRKNNCRKI